MAYECEVITHIQKPADEVWEWMSDVSRLLTVNLFHEAVLADGPVTEAGPRIPVPHNMFGLMRQDRVAHIRDYRKYFIGFGEVKAKHVPGTDAFPHYQSFEVVPLQDDTCLVVNRLRGLYQFPGAKYVGERIFHRWTPTILEEDNVNIAIAVGAMKPEDKPKRKRGLILWPVMLAGGYVVSATQRRKAVRAAKKSKKSAAEGTTNGSAAEAASPADAQEAGSASG